MPSRAHFRRGAALLTALFLSAFLFALGLGFLYFLDRDGAMQVRSQRMTRATYLARSAVEYYNYKDFVSNGAMPNIVGPLAVGPANLHQFISVTKDPSGDARCRGWIEDSSGRVLAERTMFVPKDPVTPGGRRDRAYDEGL